MTQEEKSIKIPKEIHYKLKEIAFKYDITIKVLVKEILEEALKDENFLKKVIENVTKGRGS